MTKKTTKTIFAKIRDREVPGEFVYEDEQVMAIKDINPQAPIHILIIPKKDYATLEEIDLDDTLQLHLLQTARQVAKQLDINRNYRLIMNVGRQIQDVPHVHLHLLGGWSDPNHC